MNVYLHYVVLAIMLLSLAAASREPTAAAASIHSLQEQKEALFVRPGGSGQASVAVHTQLGAHSAVLQLVHRANMLDAMLFYAHNTSATGQNYGYLDRCVLLSGWP